MMQISFTVEQVKELENILSDVGSDLRWFISIGDETGDLQDIEERVAIVRNDLHDSYCEGCE